MIVPMRTATGSTPSTDRSGGVSTTCLVANDPAPADYRQLCAALVGEGPLDPGVCGHPCPLGAVLLHIRHRR